MTFFCFCVITYQAGLPSVEECLQKAEQFCDENKFLEAMKYYLVSSSPELALDIGLNLVRGKIADGPGFEFRFSQQLYSRSFLVQIFTHVCYLPSGCLLSVGVVLFALFVCYCLKLGVYLSVRTCQRFLCFAPYLFLGSIVLTSLFSSFHVILKFNRFLHQG